MVDLGSIIGFDRDDGNKLKNARGHAVSQAEAEQIFLDGRLLIADDAKHSQNEARYHALGRTAAGRQLHVTFTLRHEGTKIRVISARDMSRKERGRYGQKA